MSYHDHSSLPRVMSAKPLIYFGEQPTALTLRGWPVIRRQLHTCWYCKTVYLNIKSTSQCEVYHEKLDTRGGRSAKAKKNPEA